MSRSYWGNGTNQQIKKLMIDHAFLSMDRVLLYIDHKNFRSQAAARKIGAVQISLEQYPLVYRNRADYTTFVLEKE
ncbi:GNAT family N-acetyltransferase [Aureitalea marina]|uniref:GNAT family N-acetyltransferase n=1 Tax=Aureitalea marina TaxID=930804 RepID=UPI0015E478EB|nr:GNAT family N-acetyltransferase [Aureitalea marina]